MKNISDYFEQVLEMTERPDVRKHLISLDTVWKRYAKLPKIERLKRMGGYTNHPALMTYPAFAHSYFLRPNQSASEALINMFYRYETTIDCANAVTIVQYYATLLAMIEHNGYEAGCKRFDALFGSATEVTPIHRRLKIIHPPVIEKQAQKPRLEPMDRIYGVDGILHPAFSGFRKNHKLRDVNQLPVGAVVYFQGDLNYKYKHPQGMEAGYNCFVISTNPLRLKTYGFSGTYTLEGLKQQSIAAFYADTTEADLMTLAASCRTDLETRQQIQNLSTLQIVDESALRLTEDFYLLNDEKFKILCTSPLSEGKALLDSEYHKRQEALKAKHGLENLRKTLNDLPKPEAGDPLAAKLSGLLAHFDSLLSSSGSGSSSAAPGKSSPHGRPGTKP